MEQNIQLQFFTLAMFSSRPSVCSLDRDILGCWVPSFNQLILIRKCTPIWLGWQAERVVLGLQAQRITFQYKSYEILLQYTVFININHMSEWLINRCVRSCLWNYAIELKSQTGVYSTSIDFNQDLDSVNTYIWSHIWYYNYDMYVDFDRDFNTINVQ